MTEQAWLIVAYLAGAAIRVFWGYWLARSKDGRAFDWRYLVGEVAATLVGLVPVVAASDFIAEFGALGYTAALLVGFGAGSVGSKSQKTVKQVRS
jgi:hypothetical protein